ncbi:hypothetical protein F5Y17DRAFT_462266, partial [Xylariaceae sp. FL0594]
MEEPVAQLLTAAARVKETANSTMSEASCREKSGPAAAVAEGTVTNMKESGARSWRQRILNQTTLAFFLMGLLVGLPTMPITTAASLMFDGITGVYGICLSLTAAVSSFAGPMVSRHVPYNVWNLVLTLASGLAYVICTLPQPLSDTLTGGNKAGPVVGTVLAGFVYAFGTQNYLAVAAFFPAEAVVALSMGSGLSIILGAGVFIGLMNGAFDQDWRRCFLVFLPTVLLMPLIWYLLFDKSRRLEAELSRKRSLKKGKSDSSSSSSSSSSGKGLETGEGAGIEGDNPSHRN